MGTFSSIFARMAIPSSLPLHPSGDKDANLRLSTTHTAQITKKSMWEKVYHGSVLTPAIIIAPLYAIGFGVLGYKTMWRISERIYKTSKPTERYLHDHFDRMQTYLATERRQAGQKARSYRIHPTFAGLSLISTSILAFVSDSKINMVIPQQSWLLYANTFICFVSALSAIPLTNTMMGNAHCKKWNTIQGKCSMVFAALTLCPGILGKLMIHLTWSVIFVGGALQRLYVLCILSQIDVPDRKTYIKYYSPQIKIATLGSIPLGMVTYLLFGTA